MDELNNVISRKGEGLVIRKANSNYSFNRSHNSLKVKQIQYHKMIMLKVADNCVGFECELLPTSSTSSTSPSTKVQKQIVRCQSSDYNSAPKAGSIIIVYHFGWWKSGKLKYPYFKEIVSV